MEYSGYKWDHQKINNQIDKMIANFTFISTLLLLSVS